MKIESFDPALPYFVTQQIRGKHVPGSPLELLQSESESGQTESLIADILRWEDDGGQMLDPGNIMAGSNPTLSGAVR
jgi:hypothetical protein